MQIVNSAGAVQFERSFPHQESKDDVFIDSWSVSAHLLSGTNGAGLLLSYDVYSEPSAPEQEPSGWVQIFGELKGKLVPFGSPLEIQGGLLDRYADARTYRSARPMGTAADVVEFKLWTGHCRIIFPMTVEWAQGKVTPAQECASNTAGPASACQYQVIPEEKLYRDGITFVRLWPNPDEKTGKLQKTVVKPDSKVELLTAQVKTEWIASNAENNSKGPLADSGTIAVAQDSDLWLKIRLDGREGWIHSEEDFRALGLPQDE